MSTSTTLDCRMLSACACAYRVGLDGTFNAAASAPFYDAVGYTTGPVPFVAGELGENIDACLVGTNADGVILSFRGTLPPVPVTLPSLLDWIQDLTADPIAVSGIPGKVHEGFWEDLSALWAKGIVAQIKQQMNVGSSPLPLYISGHSKGGALASLAAMRCLKLEGITPKAVVTFASPFAGDAGFKAGYTLPDTRYEYQDDIVPYVPITPSLAALLAAIPDIGHYFSGITTWDYEAVGTLQFINWSGKIVGDSPLLEAERVGHLLELFGELKFDQIASDHSLACGGGYESAVCPTLVCPPPSA